MILHFRVQSLRLGNRADRGGFNRQTSSQSTFSVQSLSSIGEENIARSFDQGFQKNNTDDMEQINRGDFQDREKIKASDLNLCPVIYF